MTEVIEFEKIRLELDGLLATGINQAFREPAKPLRRARALRITGEGRGFFAGADLPDRSFADDLGTTLFLDIKD